MNHLTILDLSGAALESAAAALAAGGERARALGQALDRLPVAAFSVGFATPAAQARDRTVFASFLLAFTRSSKVIVNADPARQHPINLARTLSTLSALHGQRIGLGLRADAPTAGWFHGGDGARPVVAADYLRLVSSLWDTWPLEAMVGDPAAGVFVDAERIVRITDAAYPHIGGPLTLPTDVANKPPLLLLHADGTDAPAGQGIDLHLFADGAQAFADRRIRLVPGLPSLDALLAWQAGDTAPAEVTLRAALGLRPSGSTARQQAPLFRDSAHAQQV